MDMNLNLTEMFDSTIILFPKINVSVPFKDIWIKADNQLILIHWLRRFG